MAVVLLFSRVLFVAPVIWQQHSQRRDVDRMGERLEQALAWLRTLPDQATGYKIGMLNIMELRQKAEKALGPKFDIKGFHDLVVGAGSMPLTVLERRVNDWIAVKR